MRLHFPLPLSRFLPLLLPLSSLHKLSRDLRLHSLSPLSRFFPVLLLLLPLSLLTDLASDRSDHSDEPYAQTSPTLAQIAFDNMLFENTLRGVYGNKLF